MNNTMLFSTDKRHCTKEYTLHFKFHRPLGHDALEAIGRQPAAVVFRLIACMLIKIRATTCTCGFSIGGQPVIAVVRSNYNTLHPRLYVRYPLSKLHKLDEANIT